jgi:SAM-dependent methyltransferase
LSLDRTQGFFHAYANDFDAIYSSRKGFINGVINRVFRKSMKLRFIKTVEDCHPIVGKSVLDVGCGPGHYSITLAQRGACRVVGIDFADGMLKLASQHAAQAGVGDRCEFRVADFASFTAPERFDYVIVIGFMDYMADARSIIERVVSLTRLKAFFSFPVAGGVLGWQRKLRYKNRCDLFLYTGDELQRLFTSIPGTQATIERIDRDFFLTLSIKEPASL